MNQRNTLAYQMAAADGATHAGMVVLVYDGIAKDLIHVARAIRENSIERRCAASEHALLLIGHLEPWIETMDDPRLAEALRGFYAMLRTRIVQMQAIAEAAGFEDLAQLVFDTRAAWQAKEQTSRTAERHKRAMAGSQPEGGNSDSSWTSMSPAAFSFHG